MTTTVLTSTLNETLSKSEPDLGTSPATAEQQVMIATTVAVFAVWSTIGNIITILAITTRRGMLTKCNLFILSLAVSDLLSGVIASPLWLYRRMWGFYDWKWGRFLCKLFWFTDESTSYCTALHIASLAIWRLIGVKWPHTFDEIKIRSISRYLIFLWIISLIFGGFIFSYFYDVAEKVTGSPVERCWPMCSIRLLHNGIKEHLTYYTFSSASFMFFPMLVLVLASVMIVLEMHYQKRMIKSKRRRELERNAAFQLLLISASFFFGYIPMASYVMWTTRTAKKETMSSCRFDYWFNVFAYFSLRLSECINPLVYNLASSKMRTASIDLLCSRRFCCKHTDRNQHRHRNDKRSQQCTSSKSNNRRADHIFTIHPLDRVNE